MNVLKLYPGDFINMSMQHPDELWQLTKDTAKTQAHDCNVMKTLMPGLADIWDHSDFQANLQAKIKYILIVNLHPMRPYYICQAVHYKFWLHPEALTDKGVPILPSQTQIIRTLRGIPGMCKNNDQYNLQHLDALYSYPL